MTFATPFKLICTIIPLQTMHHFGSSITAFFVFLMLRKLLQLCENCRFLMENCSVYNCDRIFLEFEIQLRT